MPMPSKGKRKPVTVRIPEELIPMLEELQSSAGVKSMGQYLADTIAIVNGREDLALELNRPQYQGVLPLTA